MKIEKINDKQIRCILSQADLADRNLLLSELAYGSQKARALFNDMMEKASNELGFEADNTPLMIEAIPISSDCLVLIVTKVEEPDELDTRFSRFSSPDPDDYFSTYEDYEDFDEEDPEEYEEDEEEEEDGYFSDMDLLSDDHAILDLMNVLDASVNQANLNDFVPLKETLSHTPLIQSLKEKKATLKTQKQLFHVLSFTDFNVLSKAARSLKNYPSESLLYKHPHTGTYYLVLFRGSQDVNYYHHSIDVLCEYGKPEHATGSTLAYYNEHYTLLLPKNAIKVLSDLA